MYKLPLKNTDDHGLGPVDAFLHFIKLGEFAYGVPDFVRSPILNDSIQSVNSAYEAHENPDNSPSNDTVLELDSSGYTTPDSVHYGTSASSVDDRASTTSGSFSLPPSDSHLLLSGLLQRVTTASNESIVSTTCFENLNSSKTIEKARSAVEFSETSTAKVYEAIGVASFEDKEIAQVVHDLVFEKYEESYTRLLNKLKKLHLSEEENRFRSVIAELEGVLKEKNANSLGDDNANEPDTSPVESRDLDIVSRSRNIQTKIYSSTDSELELEVKPIGIPQSGKLDRSFTKTTCSNLINMEPVSQVASNLDVIKNSGSDSFSPRCQSACIDDLHKHLAVPQSVPCHVNVEAQVYAFNVEERQKRTCDNDSATAEARTRLLDKRKTYNKSVGVSDALTSLDHMEKITNNSMYPSSSPLVRTETNQSHESEYNEYNFLKAALGDELLEEGCSTDYIYPQTVSIATDDISVLLSSTSSIAQSRRRRCRNRRSTETISTFDKRSLSLCNTVLQRPTTLHKKSSTIGGSASYASYETITNFSQSISTNQGKKLIKNKIFVHETIIDQAERALEYGRRKSRGFIGSPAHLEAERTLLVSKIRRQALINTLYTIQETPSETLGRITIENLRCTLNTIVRNNYHSTEQYYVCILQHKTTVYSTKIAAPNRLGWIEFGGHFLFDNVANTFDIKIELYSIQLSQAPQNCFGLPFLRATAKLPMIKLVGETHIGIMNRKNEKFSLLYRDGERFSEHKLTALVHTSIKWPDTLRGFLTIGIERQEHQPIWNRRWCVLENGKLAYYNYPSDENYCKPVGTIDLEACKGSDETYRRYLRQKTLALFIDSGAEFKIYYLSPDSTEEFNLWRKNVEVVLKLIKEWNMF